MRVVVNASTARMGGAVTYLRNLLPELAITAPDVRLTILAAPGLRDELDVTDYVVHEVDSDRPLSALTASAAWVIQHRREVDVIFSPGNVALPVPALPQVVAIRNMLLYPPHAREAGFPARDQAALAVRGMLARASTAVCSQTIVPSAAMRDVVARHSPRRTAQRISVVHHGLPRDLVPDLHRGGRIRRDARLDVVPTIVYPTLPGPHKNYATVVGALAAMQRSQAVLVLISAGRLSQPIVRLVRRYGLAARIRLLKSVRAADMPAVYGMADVAVWASATEAFGFPLLEAMRCRIPVVAADTPVNRELAGEVVRYHDTRDELGLARQLDLALGEAGNSSRVEPAYRRSLQFGWRRTAEETFRVLARAAQTGQTDAFA